MSRSSYGYVGRRSGGAAWQWVIIGMVMGFGCSVVLVLAGLALGVIGLDPNAIANKPTSTPFVITATPAPVTATEPPTEAPATETQSIAILIEPPTASPTIDATFLTLQPTVRPTTDFSGSAPLTPGTDSASGGGDLFAIMSNLASDMVPVEGGTFEMGTTVQEVSAAVQACKDGYGGDPGNCDVSFGENSYPQHQVTLSAYSMETTEVTYQQFLAFMNALGPGSHRNGCEGQPCMQTRNESETSNIQFDSANYSVPVVIKDFPVTNVTWYGAKDYCQALGRRLPTEAEWEHAARGPNGYIYPWGNDWNPNFASTRRPASGEPSPVQVFALPDGASDYGVLNLAGNVAEWVSDWYDPRFYGRPEATIPDPTGPVSGTEKVVRGGSWDAVPFFARTVHRQSRDPLQPPTAWIGFRCVADANSLPIGGSPLGANNLGGSSNDLGLPTQASSGGSEENTANSQPTLPPEPTRVTPSGTLAPGG